jgi:RelA/SpoT family (p)ppGpp synthetase
MPGPEANLVPQLDELCALVGDYLEPSQVKQIQRAYEFGAKAHADQRRLSGGPYIEHPLAVAKILAEMRMDHEALVAALLHDVLEDTPVTKEEISREFGEEVARLVDGVSKLAQIKFENYAEARAENFRKMLMAMCNDLRVILVKLADRLHNMRTIEALRPEKQRLIARETLDIYAPIAHRLGINNLRLELEDLGFATLFPKRYRILSEKIKKARGHRKDIVNQIKNTIQHRLMQEKLQAEVSGRQKHLYSIYKKMKAKHLPLSEVFDVYAFRIIVDSVDTAYRALGVVHNLFKPVPGKFKDYIAIPKSNGYQSLHTVLVGPRGVPIEIQIRTQAMDQVAKAGIAAHWAYKSGENAHHGAQTRAHEWLRGLLEIQRQAGNSREFLENVKVDLFPDEIYVFTPKGDIMKLPRGSTVVDLAYAIHTNLGHRCVAARINRRLAPLRTPLVTGQTVEIITAPGATPNPAWLNFVVTGKARAHIRHFLKNLEHDEARGLGRRMLNRELEAFGCKLETVAPERLAAALKEFKLNDVAALLEDIGLGKRLAPIVARHLIPVGGEGEVGAMKPQVSSAAPLAILGTEGMVVTFPKCCHPLPGDPILGYVSSGRGIVIHRQSCKNLAEFRNQPEKWVDVAWGKDIKTEFPAEIRLEVADERGALATIAAAIAEREANITTLEMTDRDERYVTLTLVIAVRDRKHLAQVIRALRMLKPVSRISRTKR